MKSRVVLISGMSGAGKSSVGAVMEDIGYTCIDNLPVELLDDFINQCIANNTNPRYQNVALSTTANNFMDFVKALTNEAIDLIICFIDASNDTLLHRYKSTRRMHPLLLTNQATTLEEAIAVERRLFRVYQDVPQITIDTSFLTPSALKKKVIETFKLTDAPEFSISFISFGYKNGIPMDADILIDVRFLPNPYWVKELTHLSGDDQPVYDYVMDCDTTNEYMKRLESFLDYSFEQYIKEGKNHFTVGIGCTGGQHRSVAVANALYARYCKLYRCYKNHRDKVGYYVQ